MPGRALVLGGGGVVGIAWETGVLKGLHDAGADMSEADLIVGTSAGATVGTQLAAGLSLDALLANQLAASDGQMERLQAQMDPKSIAAFLAGMEGITELNTSTAAQFGALALAANTPTEEQRLTMVTARLGVADWPGKRLLLTAVDAHTGALVTWERGSGVALAQAVASSGAVPGMFPPTTIQGHRYIDGGLRSGTSADLARGHDVVVIVAPIGSASGGAMGRLMGRRLAAEIGELARGGAQVRLIEPDSDALAAFGPNLMDPSHRTPAAEAGVRQGKIFGPDLRGLWAGGAHVRIA